MCLLNSIEIWMQSSDQIPQKDSDSIVPARIQIYLCQLPLQNKRARPILDKGSLIFGEHF